MTNFLCSPKVDDINIAVSKQMQMEIISFVRSKRLKKRIRLRQNVYIQKEVINV